MTFEPKISGTAIKDFEIDLIFEEQIVTLKEVNKKIKKQHTMDFILDNFRFSSWGDEWVAILDYDTIYKISVLENYPEYEKELSEYFGVSWLNQYLRFGH